MSMRNAVLSRIKKGSIPRGEELTKPTETIFGGFVGSPSLESEPKKEESEIPPKPDLRERIEELLAEGPRPYEEVLAACGGDEDALRDAIRNWPELIAYDSGGVWLWELAKDPAFLGERIGIRSEAEIPENLGNPVFTYREHVLAWENDTPETKVYAWCLVNLFPGRPLSVDIEPVGRLLGLSSREVRDSLARLVKNVDLVRTVERGRELFRLNVQYPEGGTNATGD